MRFGEVKGIVKSPEPWRGDETEEVNRCLRAEGSRRGWMD